MGSDPGVVPPAIRVEPFQGSVRKSFGVVCMWGFGVLVDGLPEILGSSPRMTGRVS
jgi:hypothetical protein